MSNKGCQTCNHYRYKGFKKNPHTGQRTGVDEWCAHPNNMQQGKSSGHLGTDEIPIDTPAERNGHLDCADYELQTPLSGGT